MVLYEDFFVCCGWEEVEGFFAGGEGGLERGRQGYKVFTTSYDEILIVASASPTSNLFILTKDNH